MKIGFTELLLVFVVALLVIGPDKLPRYAQKLGAAMAAFRKASDEAAQEIKKNVVEPLEEAQRPLREAVEPLEDLHDAVQDNLKDVQSSLNNIGKRPARTAPEKPASPDAASPTSPDAVEPAEAVPEPDAEHPETVPEPDGEQAVSA